MKLSTRRVLVWAGAIALAVVLIRVAVAPAPVPVDVAGVERGSLRVTLDEEGATRVRDRFVISSPLAGRVLRIQLQPGDPVRAGESVLATLQPSDPSLLDARSRGEAEARVKGARAALDRSDAQRDQAQAELEFAENDLVRVRRLAEDGIVSDEALDQAELLARTREKALRAAESALRNAQFELERAQAGLVEVVEVAGAGPSSRTVRIRSPVDGVVLRRLRESEAVVGAGEALLEVGDPADLEIVADFLSRDAVRIRPGYSVAIEEWGGERPLLGRVRRVEPHGFTKVSALGVEEQRVNVIIDFDEPHDAFEALGDGYRVEVRVIEWEGSDLTTVARSSLFRHGEGWAVFVADGDRASLRTVEIGRRNSLEAVVLAGLEPGEQVVLHPSEQVADGVEITPRDS